MANSILKWCKAKFLHGYKHINVEASEEMCGNRSDTETLVRGSEKEFLLTTPTPDSSAFSPIMGEDVPPISHLLREEEHPYLKTSPGHRNHRLQWTIDQQDAGNRCMDTYLEEVTCDLSITGGATERQEFAFTLYDFDGHGRVTKDDIASLVQSIYEAVGSSLSMPPCGSRTIRVKLTVAPDASCNSTSLRLNETNTASTTPKDSPRNLFDDSYSPRTINDFSSSPGESPRILCDDNSPIISPRKDEGIEVSPRTPRIDDNLGPRTPRREYRRRRRRRSTFHRQELLQIIQANMEKNNLYYPPLQYRYHSERRRRKNCGCGYHCGSPPDPATLKARLLECECLCNCCCDIDNCNKGEINTAPTCGHPHHCAKTGYNKNHSSHKVRHNRSRSHDYSNDSPHIFRHQLLDNNTHQPLPPSNTPDRPTSPNNRSNSPKITNHHHHEHNHLNPQLIYHARSRSCEANDSNDHSQQPFSSKKKSFESWSHPHKYKHRNDEHSRAMSQVVAWLERSTFKDGANNNNNKTYGVIDQSKENFNSNSNNCAHAHHVHQHYHHHYHHYPTAPSLII